MLLEERLEDRFVHGLCARRLRCHQIDEEDEADDAVVRHISQNEADQELDNLNNAINGPVAEPGVGLLFVIVFDG